MLTKDKAVCIRVIDYSETSQVVTFFTRQTGKAAMIARGSKRPRRPFGGPVEMFSCGKIVFSDSSREKLATLVEFEPSGEVVNFSVLAADGFVLNCCLLSAELVNLLTKDYDPHPGLYDGLLQFLRVATRTKVTDAARGKLVAGLTVFQLTLLREIGICPVLQQCVNCKNSFSPRWPEVYFSSSANGLVCRDCQGTSPDRTRLTKRAAQGLASIESLASADDQTIGQVEEILMGYITDTLGRPPKMAKYILQWQVTT